MPPSSAPDTYPAFRSRPERIALALVLLVVVGLPLAVLGFQRLQAAGPARVIALTARLPTAEHGGWSPEVITVQRGERVRLRITSADVIHGFSIPKLGVEVARIEPGKVAEVEIAAERPGRYAFQCTVWCQLGHWRMRGVLEIVDQADPLASALDVDPPETDWVATGIDIDVEHLGRFAPSQRPDAGNGARLWADLSPRSLGELAAALPLRELSPSDLFAYLSGRADAAPAADSHGAHGGGMKGEVAWPELPEAAALAALGDAQRWDIVAALYAATTMPAELARGAAFFERDCTGCHGLSGRGDGPGAAALAEPGVEGQQHAGMATDRPPTDFTDLAAQAGASDMLYYGKMVRGGMGTSMPYWGTIYTEDELWAVIAYLRGFAFDLAD